MEFILSEIKNPDIRNIFGIGKKRCQIFIIYFENLVFHSVKDFLDFDNTRVGVQNVSAHGGHGTAFTQDECPDSSQVIFNHDQDHHGELEYFQFSNCLNGLDTRVASNWHTTVIVQ